VTASNTKAAQRCYLCGKSADETPEGKLTREHVPPRNLFPQPRPSDLITVPCCAKCNHDAHKDDEYLRLAVSGYYNTNQLGKRIWKEKAVGSTLRKKRLRGSVDAMAKSFKKIALITPRGVEDALEVMIKKAPVNRSLVRITAGLLSILYPEIDRNELSFTMTQLDQFKLNDAGFRQIQRMLRYFQKGNGVYRCWHYVETTYSLKGAWVHMFFDSAAYLVEQSSERILVPPW
jgi:hypothetical protein